MKTYQPLTPNKRNHAFSMVEVVVALIVIVIGLVGIIALFPFVSEQNRTTVGSSYVGDAAEQFLHFNASKITTDWGWLSAFPKTRPGYDESSFVWSNESLLNNPNVKIRFAAPKKEAEATFDPNVHQKGVFLLEQMINAETEFKAVMRVWKDIVEFANGGMSANINVEISWPADKPYAKREAEVFSLEVFKKLESDVSVAGLEEEEEVVDCEHAQVNGGGFTTAITSVVENPDGTHTIELTVRHDGCPGPACPELSHYSVQGVPGTYKDLSFDGVSGTLVKGPNLGKDPFKGFKIDGTSGIGDGMAGEFTITYTLTGGLQDQMVSAKAGKNGNITGFSAGDFEAYMKCMAGE